MAPKFDKRDYSEEELISVQRVHPKFLCPNCGGYNWDEQSVFQTPPGARLWRGVSVCKGCKANINWLIDPDRTIEFQTPKMHRPIGY